MRKSFLFITSLFPPLGGPGVQRQLYYVHYAPQFGWDPIVLTTADIEYHFHDPSLLAMVPASTHIIRTNSLEFGRILWYLRRIRSSIKIINSSLAPDQAVKLTPNQLNMGRKIRDWVTIVDDRILWIPFAYPRALSVIKNHGIDVIVARGGPHSNVLLGKLVAQKTQKPLVLDLADPWLEYPYLNMPTVFHRWVNKSLESSVFRFASRIAVSCPSIKRDIHAKYPSIPDEHVRVITNGFDSYQMQSAPAVSKEKLVTISHVGTLSWIRLQAFRVLCRALNGLLNDDPVLMTDIELKLVGTCDPLCDTMIREYGLEGITRRIEYVPHLEALGHMKSSDLLFLPVSEEMSNDKGIYLIPGKLFEYIGSGTPILMIGAKASDAAKIILDENFGVVYESWQEEQIKSYLSDFVKKRLRTKRSKTVSHDEVWRARRTAKYERRSLAASFMNLLDQVS